MADYVIVKKKLNVPLLIVLLLCAFVPGIIYLIWVAIPKKVSLAAPKSNGWVLRIIGASLALACYVFWMILVGDEVWMTFIWHLMAAAIAFIPAVLGKKSKSRAGLVIGLIFTIVTFILCIVLGGLYYGWPAFIGCILSFIGYSKAFKYHDYYVLGKRAVAEAVEAEVVAEEKAE